MRVGEITYESAQDATFAYSDEYLSKTDAVPISLSLPLQKEAFSCEETKNYFEGLLPEGFTRRSVASLMRVHEQDYISILCGLGKECLGAIQVMDESEEHITDYETLSMEQVRELAKEGAVKSAALVTKSHLSLTGASGKVGLYYDQASDQWYLPKGCAPSTHIVKQSHVRLSGIVANEQLSLQTASKIGIETPESFIINTGNAMDEDVLFATKRYDRIFDENSPMIQGKACPLRLHQEDFAQALGIGPLDKYEREKQHYLKRMFDIIRNHSSDPINDQLKLWDIIVFDYLIGNTDNHIKNLSLLYGRDMKTIRLAPAYDIISTSVYEESTREMAFYIGEEKNLDRINLESFESAASEVGIGSKMAMKRMRKICDQFEKALTESASLLQEMGYENVAMLKDKILLTGGYALLS